jgi:hypothetical protein
LGGVWSLFRNIFKVGEISLRTEKIPEMERKINELPCNSHKNDIKTVLNNIITLQNFLCVYLRDRHIEKYPELIEDIEFAEK